MKMQETPEVIDVFTWVITYPNGRQVTCSFGTADKPVGCHFTVDRREMEVLEEQVKRMAAKAGAAAELATFRRVS